MESPDDNFLWNQFCRLGEAIGDGLHHEDPWISKEYSRLSKILMPDMHADLRKRKNASVNILVQKRLLDDKCSCGSGLKQVRSGSYVVQCVSCGKKYKYKTKRIKKH